MDKVRSGVQAVRNMGKKKKDDYEVKKEQSR